MDIGRLVLGIDLGTQGAVALVDSCGELVAVEDLPVLPDGPRARPHINAAVLADLLRSWQPNRAYVEFVGARPTDSRVGAFSFGMARGSTEAVLATLGIPVRMITAPTWKRIIGIGPGTGQKSTARAEATRRWPRHAPLFARVRDEWAGGGGADRHRWNGAGGARPMTRAEMVAYNRGLADLASIAIASADALRARLAERPTRYSFAIAAMESLAEAAGTLALPLPPDGSEPAAAMLPRPSTPPGGTAAAFAMAGGDQR